MASRHHVEGITATINEALGDADVSIEDIDAIAVTEGPGLIGALLIGVNAAKALAFAYDKPLIPVHHIAGHIYANHIEEPLTFPLIALIVSGGHTELVYMKDRLSFEVIGETRDDAVGEAYDKVARTIGLNYQVVHKLIGWLLKVKILIHSLVFGWIKIVMILVLVG